MSRFVPSSAFSLFNPSGLYDPRANGYSHVAQVRPGARLLFMAGQGGEGVDGSLSPVFADQVDQALANLGIALAALDADFSHVFKLTLLIVDHSQEKLHTWVQSADKVWHGAMKPVCTLIPVPRLALDGMQVEIEATAAVNDAPPQSS